MTGFRIDSFSGISPGRGARLLDPNQAQVALNCRLTSGYLEAFDEKKLVINPGITGLDSIFRLTSGSNEYWLGWNVDVDVVRAQIANDSTQRFYYTGDGEPRMSNLAMAIASTPYPSQCFVLGVYPPVNAPGVSHAGGVGSSVDRSFVYTFVTPLGEESQPTPASAVVTGKVDGTWTISGMDVAPLNSFGVTGASWAAGTATYSIPSTFGLRVGEQINVTGITPSGYNVTKAPITAIGVGTVSVAIASNPGAYSAGGTLSRVAPHNTSGMLKRIYWTETTAAGTSYKFVKEIAVSLTSTTVAGNTTSQEALPSATWEMPPADAKGIVAHPSGFYAMFRNNEVCLSEPGFPYAWPSSYRQASDFPIVGLGVWGSTIVVCTTGNPYNLSGVDSAAMTMLKVDQPWPCQSKKGIASLPFGVTFPAPQGLAIIGSQGEALITAADFQIEDWREITPSSFIATQYAGRYVASFDPGTGTRQIIIIDKQAVASIKNVNINAARVWSDPTSGDLYLVYNDSIYKFDYDIGTKMSYDWMSKEINVEANVNMAACRIDCVFKMTADQAAAAQAAYDAALAANNATLAAGLGLEAVGEAALGDIEVDGADLSILPSVNFDALTFQLYTSKGLVFSRSVSSNQPFRLPGDYKDHEFAVRLQGNVLVKSIKVAETMDQLNQ